MSQSLGGARERPASRKCCRRSVIRRRSADLNVYNVTSNHVFVSMSIGHTIFLHGKRLCFLAHCSHGNALDHPRKSPFQWLALRESDRWGAFPSSRDHEVIGERTSHDRFSHFVVNFRWLTATSCGQETSLLDALHSCKARYCDLLMIHVQGNTFETWSRTSSRVDRIDYVLTIGQYFHRQLTIGKEKV